VDKFAQLKNAFEQVGFKDEEVNSIYCILAAILHLGDIEFGEIITDNNTDNKSTVIDLTPIHRSNYICSTILNIKSLMNELHTYVSLFSLMFVRH
jgi:myosin heavy subunit